MRHQNSVFHELLKHVPWDEFDRLVEDHGADFRVRRLTTKSQFVALLYGQWSGAVSLREIVAGLESHAARLYHLGAGPAQRSTLADANARRSSAVFTELFAHMVQRAHRGLRRRIAETTYLIDSTGLRLSALCDWARFSAGVLVSSDTVALIQKNSEQRVADDPEFVKINHSIQRFLERKNRKTISLNEEQARKDRAEAQADAEAADPTSEEDPTPKPDAPIFPKNAYTNEVLNITLDYAGAVKGQLSAARSNR